MPKESSPAVDAPLTETVVVDGGGHSAACEKCLLRLALAYLLAHATGTGTLTLDSSDLEELGIRDLESLTITLAPLSR